MTPIIQRDEDRFVLLGYSFQAGCLIVSHRICDPIDFGPTRGARGEEDYWRLQ